MTTQTVSLQLPDEIYQRFKDLATTTHRSLEDVLFQTLRGNLPPSLDDLLPEQRAFVSDLENLSYEDLWAVAKENLPPAQWRRHQRLLHKAEDGALTHTEQMELARLRE